MTADGPALLREWIPAVYPPAALKARRSGMVTVRFIVDPAGQVIQARALDDSDEEFVEPALAAVRAWVFTPAMEKGEPVACCLETLMAFSPAQGQRKPSPRKIPPEDQILQLAPRTSPQPRATPEGEYPGVLQSRQLEGAVAFRCRVSPEGRVLQTRILDATHADFVVPALAALEQWEFSPAMQGDLPVEADVEARINFTTIVGKPADVLAANGITAPDGRPPDVTPELMVATDPVWPAERLLQGEGGSATVEFTVRERGAVRNVRMIEASHPEFGYALAAAVETWHFSPDRLGDA